VARREDLLEWDPWPSAPRRPVVGREERPQPWLAATRIPWPVSEGHPVRSDWESERQGVCHLFLLVEPLRGWPKVVVRDRRTQRDGAEGVRVVLDAIAPRAIGVRLVPDNLNRPPTGSLDEALAPEAAGRRARR
jgi:hypothetical protein